MSEDGANYFQTSEDSTERTRAEGSQASSDAAYKFTRGTGPVMPAIGMIRYPCCGNVEPKSYVHSRIHDFSFRRLHDEWVALGKPRINTEHWPRMAGHHGLPSSPEDLIKVAEYYDRKLFSQVLLDSQGKPADRVRPLDDFLVSMITTAAVVHSDFVVYRLRCAQPSLEEAALHGTWHRHFSNFMHNFVRFLCDERKACDHLGPHNCILPLLFGQASSMSLPTLLRTFDYQVQLFQNLFPNFGEHISRCAATQASQPWMPSPRYTGGHPRGDALNQAHDKSPEQRHDVTTHGQRYNNDEKGQPLVIESDDVQQRGLGPRGQRYVAHMPTEMQQRVSLLAAESAFHREVPPETEVSLIDSGGASSTSTSTSSASTPLPATTNTSAYALQSDTGVSSTSFLPISEASLSAQRQISSLDLARADGGEDPTPSNLSLRPPQVLQGRWPGVSEGSPSEEYAMTTLEEGMSTPQDRASTYSYFSSLPTTPSELLSPTPVRTTQQDPHAKTDRRTHRSNTGLFPMTSFSSDPESRKRTRAEQNREKMKAYHKRVMQQREALTNILTDMSAHVGPIPLSWTNTRTASQLADRKGESHFSTDMAGGNLESAFTSPIERGTQEPIWSATLRNKQKQESKARLRKREIVQVQELGLYATYAHAALPRPAEPNSSVAAGGSDFQGTDATRAENDQSRPDTSWWQIHTQVGAGEELYKPHATLRVFLRHRPNWIALISAEQRLASEVAKLSLNTEEGQLAAEGAKAKDNAPGALENKRVKALLDQIQIREMEGTLDSSLIEPPAALVGPSASAQASHFVGEDAGIRPLASSVELSGVKASRMSLQQRSPTQTRHFQTGSMGATGSILPPAGSDFGAAAPPADAMRPMHGDERADYFSREPRRHGGRIAGSSEPEASLLSMHMPSAYAAEQASAQFAQLTPTGAPPIAGSASAIPPSVVPPNLGYKSEAVYSDVEGAQRHRGSPEKLWHAHDSMVGMQQGQPSSSMPELQLHMSTPFTGRDYGQTLLQDATIKPLQQAAGAYPSQSLQHHAYHNYDHARSQASGQVRAHLPPDTALYDSIATSASMDAYRPSQPPSPQYPSQLQHPSGQQNPYSGPQ